MKKECTVEMDSDPLAEDDSKASPLRIQPFTWVLIEPEVIRTLYHFVSGVGNGL